jgi:hypothetical protein
MRSLTLAFFAVVLTLSFGCSKGTTARSNQVVAGPAPATQPAQQPGVQPAVTSKPADQGDAPTAPKKVTDDSTTPQTTKPTTAPNPQTVVAPAQPTKPARRVVALGTQSRKAEEFMSQGYNAAILNATWCQATGEFPGESKCFVQYDDGSTEWANASNRTFIQDFIAKLKADQKAEAAKAAKKKSKKS